MRWLWLLGIAGGNDGGGFDHQDNRPLRGACAMDDALGHDKALLRSQLDGAVFEVDEKAALKHKKELVVMVVLVPVILALHDSEANDRVVDLAERLVVPPVATGFHQGGNIDQIKGRGT